MIYCNNPLFSRIIRLNSPCLRWCAGVKPILKFRPQILSASAPQSVCSRSLSVSRSLFHHPRRPSAATVSDSAGKSAPHVVNSHNASAHLHLTGGSTYTIALFTRVITVHLVAILHLVLWKGLVVTTGPKDQLKSFKNQQSVSSTVKLSRIF